MICLGIRASEKKRNLSRRSYDNNPGPRQSPIPLPSIYSSPPSSFLHPSFTGAGKNASSNQQPPASPVQYSHYYSSPAMEDYQQVQQQQGGRASNKIRDIVRLQQLLKKWKKLATVTPSSASGGGKGGGRSSVPRGSFAVYVGDEMRRFVIPTEYLGHWAFAELLREAEEEFGFRHEGALRIPCDVEVFEGILRLVQGRKKDAMCDCSCSSETEILCR
ncbi:hypothetical protein HU200_006155 [Digitaria exilis]|uniref:Small auxin up regulated protein n=1 Tax=Digitaria exilis TaxID=1010633 RepID=A0A835FQJ0_9POAL|nr:hypothetical protein HU200_006155 [Digitaria exilis]